MNELKITGRLAEVGNLDGGDTVGASIYAGDGRYVEVRNLSEDEARAIAPAFGEMVTVSIGPESQSAQADDVVRFCPHCALIGEVGEFYLDCCPDGSGAYNVPRKFAEQCRSTFKLAINSAAASPSPAVAVEDEVPVAYIAQLSKTSHKSLTWSNHGGFIGTEYIPLYTRPSPSLAVRDGVDERDAALEAAAQAVENEICECCLSEDEQSFAAHAVDTIRKLKGKPNADCSGEPTNCPDNEGYGCACDPMNKATKEKSNGD